MTSPRIDLHAHSRASDGTQSPRELVHAAAAAGLDVVALTDHDSTTGWPEAAAAADEAGIGLVRGLEISTRYASPVDGRVDDLAGSRGVHLLAYLPDATYPPLSAALDRINEGRTSRVPEVVARLRLLDVDITATDVRAMAGDTVAPGRPHIADALVHLGVVASREEAFDRFLGAGRPAHVDRYAADLQDMIRLVVEAGGVPVIAHPWGRGHDLANLGTDQLGALAEVGLVGLEVDHQDHDPPAREALRRIARSLDLIVTGSSDHHGLGKVDHELGCNTTAPAELERLLASADENAARSGRHVPKLVTG